MLAVTSRHMAGATAAIVKAFQLRLEISKEREALLAAVAAVATRRGPSMDDVSRKDLFRKKKKIEKKKKRLGDIMHLEAVPMELMKSLKLPWLLLSCSRNKQLAGC